MYYKAVALFLPPKLPAHLLYQRDIASHRALTSPMPNQLNAQEYVPSFFQIMYRF